MTPEAGLDQLAAEGDPVALTRALVGIPSVNPLLEEQGKGEKDIARRCHEWLEAWGYATRSTEVAPGRWNVVAQAGEGRPVTLLNGHLDTVGVEGMTVDPFEAEIRDGRIWGRGACDMKGGVAALLSAARAFVRRRGSGTVIVALTADEEHGSIGMQRLIEDGVVADRAIVCEPTSLAVMPAHKGFVWINAVFRGRAAHGSMPSEGVDAIRHAALYLAELESLHAALEAGVRHPLLGPPSFHAGTIRGGSAPSVYPDRCALELERRTLPDEGVDAVVAEFRAALERLSDRVGGIDASIEVGLSRPGSDVSGDAPVVQALLRAISAEQVEPRVQGMTAWVDAAFLNQAGVPAVCFGPGTIAKAHTADEFVEVEEVRTAARVLERLLLD
jgi:acetylornithine deacetylase